MIGVEKNAALIFHVLFYKFQHFQFQRIHQ